MISKDILSDFTGTNIDELAMPVMEKIEVPDDTDWKETFMAIANLSHDEWCLAVAKQEKKESSKPFQERLEEEWQLAEED